jgi:hypothetical protein
MEYRPQKLSSDGAAIYHVRPVSTSRLLKTGPRTRKPDQTKNLLFRIGSCNFVDRSFGS